MILAAKRAAWLRDEFVIRLGAFLMVIGLLFSLLDPPKAKAIAVVDDILVVASVFFQACGLTWSLQGAMEQSGFTNSVAGLLTDYLAADFAGQTPAQWAGDIAANIAPGGKLIIPKLLAQKLGAFANWVVQKKAITAGGSPVIISGDYTFSETTTEYLINGIPIYKDTYSGFASISRKIVAADAGVKIIPFSFCPSFYLLPSNDRDGYLYFPDGSSKYVCDFNKCDFRFLFSYGKISGELILRIEAGTRFLTNYVESYGMDVLANRINQIVAAGVAGAICTSIVPAKAIDIPDTSTMADNESIAIDTAITAGTTAELLQRILDAIMAGTLTATKEIAKVEPLPGEITDVNELGLPALKLVLTTRFPFSIPWDVGRAIKLLVAPAKTPYFEVDFMAPIAKRFPGGFKGSTKIVLDFEQYAIIGTVSRWTSTIGFCLALAGGTKRLIWVG